jgi:hypothetical protein
MKHMMTTLVGVFLLGLAGPALADPCAAVKREMAFGQAATEDAKDEAGFKRAAAEFKKAADKAPGCAAAFFNLGIIQEKAGELAAAKAAYERYLKLAPKADDAAQVEQRIFKLEYRLQRAVEAEHQASDWQAFSGDWCFPSECNDPNWGTRDRAYRVTVTGDKIVIAQKWRWRLDNTVEDMHAIFRGTISPNGKLKGSYSRGTTWITNSPCRGRTFEDIVDFSGELKKDTVIDAQGREISGGAIRLRWNDWTKLEHNLPRCTYERASGGRWHLNDGILKRRN